MLADIHKAITILRISDLNNQKGFMYLMKIVVHYFLTSVERVTLVDREKEKKECSNFKVHTFKTKLQRSTVCAGATQTQVDDHG